tara:strand:+ start:309 stop:812 length:504 start_codon:yes stop_codon:yes gene_type:complete
MGYQLVETISVGSGGAASIEFTSIPQDAIDLVCLVSGRATSSSAGSIEVRLSGGSGANYYQHNLIGNGDYPEGTKGTDSAFQLITNPSTYTSNTFGNMSILVANYAASKATRVSIDAVSENNGTAAFCRITNGSWNNTSAVTSLKLFKPGDNLAQHSTASLYKITAD